MSKPVLEPARTIYRLDRTMRSGEVFEYYGQEIYDTRYNAERAICLRFSKYQDQMSVVEVHQPAHHSIKIL